MFAVPVPVINKKRSVHLFILIIFKGYWKLFFSIIITCIKIRNYGNLIKKRKDKLKEKMKRKRGARKILNQQF